MIKTRIPDKIINDPEMKKVSPQNASSKIPAIFPPTSAPVKNLKSMRYQL
jgi:hypothetical protein